MRKLRLPLIGMVLLALHGPSSVIVVAQDADPASEPDALAPAVVTGTNRIVGPNQSAQTVQVAIGGYLLGIPHSIAFRIMKGRWPQH